MKASGIILAGGKSSRMKFNKAFVKLEGKPVIKIIIDKFSEFFDEVLISSNEPELYKIYDIPICKDIYPNLGPASGIHSALYHASFDSLFILGCDMPFINMELVSFMLNKLENYDSVIPEIDSYLQPLSAVYSKTCLPVFTSCLNNDKLKLVRIFEELNALRIRGEQIKIFGDPQEIFLNVNDSEALKLARDIAGKLFRVEKNCI